MKQRSLQSSPPNPTVGHERPDADDLVRQITLIGRTSMPAGATSEETETALDMKHQTVSARYKDLRDWGYIDYLRNAEGNRSIRPTSSGRAAFVHICTEKGKLAIALGSPIAKPGATDPTRRRHRGNPLSAAAFNSLGSQLPTLRLKVLAHIHSMTE
jgi:hypothetical protein